MIFAMNRTQGFTFIELFITVIIIGILVGVSFPNFRKTFNQMRLNSFSSELQSFMNYLSERAIVERRIIYLNIDNDKKKYWARIKDTENRLKSYSIPNEISVEPEQNSILFYPDGQIDKVTIKIAGLGTQNIDLTTKGVFCGVKLQTQK